jgi:hypothetical protein
VTASHFSSARGFLIDKVHNPIRGDVLWGRTQL